MDPMLTNDEQKMREELLRHEFPFDEKAWASMESLLRDQKRKPLAGLPPETTVPAPGPSRSWILFLVWLCSFALGSAALFWWREYGNMNATSSAPGSTSFKTDQPHSILQKTDNAGAIPSTPTLKDESKNVQSVAAVSPNTQHPDHNTKELSAASQAQKDSSVIPRTSFRIHDDREVFSPKTGHRKKPEQVSVSEGIEKLSGLEKHAGLPLSTPDVQRHEANETVAINQNSRSDLYSEQPSSTAVDSLSASMVKLPGFDALALPFCPIEILPDSIIRPLVDAPKFHKYRQRGWILGLNANTVQYDPLRLSVLPHLGYFVNYRLQPGTFFQAEFVAKFVSGYHLHAEFMDIIPGGSTHIIHNTNNMLFLEVPLLIKHTFIPGQSWLLGVKPAWNRVIAPTGLVSLTNNAPSRFYNSQEGVRYFDFGLVLGWEWQLNKRWALDMRYNQGLLDLSFDQFYRDNSTHVNSDLQVSLRYFVGKKIRKHAPKTLFPVATGH